jgi:hypothetical protein
MSKKKKKPQEFNIERKSLFNAALDKKVEKARKKLSLTRSAFIRLAVLNFINYEGL